MILDCGRHEVGNGRKDDDDWWLDLYVLLSRATRSEDLLLTRAPPVDFLLRGPPAGLHKQLKKFLARAGACQKTARALAAQLGFEEFLRAAES